MTGRCQCGAVRYMCDAVPTEIFVCHCVECRRQSSSAFGISVIVSRAGFRLTQGATRFWVRDAASGNRVKCHFCADCGSRLWHEAEGRDEPTLSVKGGSLDTPPDLRGAVHIWVSRKLPGVLIDDGSPQFAEEP